MNIHYYSTLTQTNYGSTEAINFSTLTVNSQNDINNFTYNLISNSSSLSPLSSASSIFSFQSRASIIIRIIAYLIILIAAFIGNILVIATLVFTRRMRSVTNTFLTNLAISDLLLGIFCMPFTLTGSIIRNFIFGPTMCKLIPYFQAISVGVSAWTLVAISLERYFAICYPLESRKWQTLSHSYRVIGFIWLSNALFMSPIAVLSTLLPTKISGKFKCREVWPSPILEEIFNLTIVIILLLIPFLVMIFTYTLISRTLCSSYFHNNGQLKIGEGNGLKNGHSENSTFSRNEYPDDTSQSNEYSPASLTVFYNHHSGDVRIMNADKNRTSDATLTSIDEYVSNRTRITHKIKARIGHSRRIHTQVLSKKRIIRMLCVLVMEFFICWTPIYVFNVWSLYAPKQAYSILGPSAISFIHLLSYVSSCTNPITYCFMHRKFREALLILIRCPESRNGYVMSELDFSSSNLSPSTIASNNQQYLKKISDKRKFGNRLKPSDSVN